MCTFNTLLISLTYPVNQNAFNNLDELQKSLWLQARYLFLQHDLTDHVAILSLNQQRLNSDLYAYLQKVIFKKISDQIQTLQKQPHSNTITSAGIKILQLQTVHDELIHIANKKAAMTNPAMSNQQFNRELKQDLIKHLEIFAAKVDECVTLLKQVSVP